MPTIPDITNEKPTARTNRDGLDFVFSTTHPLTKEQVDVLYHDDDVRV